MPENLQHFGEAVWALRYWILAIVVVLPVVTRASR